MLLEGIFAAITTPFYPDGRLYPLKLEQNVERYSRTPLSGLVVLGSTGEVVFLREQEQVQVLETAIATASTEKVMVAGIGQESVVATLGMAEHAARLNYDAVLVRTPHYYRNQMRPSEMLHYYRAIADSSALPVLLYSVPACTAYDLPVAIVAELAAHPNIIGMKDSSNSPQRIREIVTATASFRHKVTVTPTFAAVTERMVRAAIQDASANLVQLESFAGTDAGGGSTAVAVPIAPAIKTRTAKLASRCSLAQRPRSSSLSRLAPLARYWHWLRPLRKRVMRCMPRSTKTIRHLPRRSSNAYSLLVAGWSRRWAFRPSNMQPN
jgi:hypothetical protein